jgi:hypothetical protein
VGHELLQHFSSELVDHFVKHIGRLDIGWHWAISGEVVWITASEASMMREVAGMGAVYVHWDRGWRCRYGDPRL